MADKFVPLIHIQEAGVDKNVPVGSLDHYIQWTELEAEIRFREVYMLKGTQTIVKDSTHILQKKPPAMAAEQGQVG